MIRAWVPGGYRLGECPSCRRGGHVEIESRAQYQAYHEWYDGRLAGRCQHCGFRKEIFIGRGRGYDAALQRLIYEWGKERGKTWRGS